MNKYKVVISKFRSKIIYADSLDSYADGMVYLYRRADTYNGRSVAAIFNTSHIIGIYEVVAPKDRVKVVLAEEKRNG